MSGSGTIILFSIVAFVAGLASAVQTSMNGTLGRSMDDPLGAALWSFISGGTVVIILYMLRGGNLSQASLGAAPWWSLFGGLMGAILVVGMIVSAPRIGLMTALIAIVLGQAVMSMTLDAIGVWGEPRAITLQRLAAIGLLVAGFWASRG